MSVCLVCVPAPVRACVLSAVEICDLNLDRGMRPNFNIQSVETLPLSRRLEPPPPFNEFVHRFGFTGAGTRRGKGNAPLDLALLKVSMQQDRFS